ncbi:MAG: hypothetical protein EBS18_06030, partial [Actinobacteria bacterium]|nr:hypothetical protein [Actinomycetota bacterium]
ATVGVGFTVIVKLIGLPVHVTPAFVYFGVTTIVEVMGEEVVFVAVYDNEPVPLAARPIAMLLFVHSYTVPGT